MSDVIKGVDAAVIPFPRTDLDRTENAREAALEELPVRTRRDPSPCPHTASWVSEAARTVVCRGCGCQLDPIAALAQIARNREFLVNQGRALRAHARWASQELERLKREERNTKARLRLARRSRDDEEALAEAAKAVATATTGRPWSSLTERARQNAIALATVIVETYAGAGEEQP